MIKRLLNKPFPIIESTKEKIIASFVFSLMIYIFLMVFQPFGIDDIKVYKSIFISGFFFITLVILLFHSVLIPVVFPKFFNPDKWTVGKNIFFILWQTLITAVFNWLYNSTVGIGITSKLHSLPYFIFITFSVGFFPIVLLTLLVENYLSIKNKRIAQSFSENLNSEPRNKVENNIIINSENKDENIELQVKQLICIKSEGNYASVYFFQNNKIKKQLIRNSLSKLENQFDEYSKLKRCHRSYIVNFENVERVSGNARNYNLHVKDLEFTIPISRGFPKEFISELIN